jgi:hypothetical protein
LASSLFDNIERGTDDGTLRFDCTAGSLLGNFLSVKVRLATGIHILEAVHSTIDLIAKD